MCIAGTKQIVVHCSLNKVFCHIQTHKTKVFNVYSKKFYDLNEIEKVTSLMQSIQKLHITSSKINLKEFNLAKNSDHVYLYVQQVHCMDQFIAFQNIPRTGSFLPKI